MREISNSFSIYICLAIWMNVVRWILFTYNISRWKIYEVNLYASIEMSCVLFEENKLWNKIHFQCTKNSKNEKSNQIHWTLTLVCWFDCRGESSGRLWRASYSILKLVYGRLGEIISRPLLKCVSYSKRIKYLINKKNVNRGM